MPRDEIGLRRQWALLTRLTTRSGGATLRELAAEFAVTERTVRRDLETFRSVGFPIREEVGDAGRKAWRVATAREFPPLQLSYDEAVALHLGRRMLGPLAGTPFEQSADNAFRKIRSTLGPMALEYLRRFAAFFHVVGAESRGYDRRSECVDAMLLAIEEFRPVRIVYRSEGSAEASPREVHPRGLIEHRGSLYLVALDPAAGRVKHYKVDRVESAEVGPPSPAAAGDFDLAAHMAEAFGVYRGAGDPVVVRVRFAPEAARYVRESTHHARRDLVDEPDGGVVAGYLVSGTEEIKRWVLGFGVKAVVLEPESLRSEVAAELRAAASAYDGPGPVAAVGRPARIPDPSAPPRTELVPTIDLAFSVRGTTIPIDYGYALFGAISRLVSAVHGDRRVGVHPIRGVHLEPTRLTLVPASRLRLRLPSEEVATYLALAGATLDLDGSRLAVGIPAVESLRPAPSLLARLVTIGHLQEPEPFLATARRQLANLGVAAAPEFLPDPHLDRAGRPVRRILRIKGKRIVGFPLLIPNLTAEESLVVQERGLGSRRRMGCGLFVPLPSRSSRSFPLTDREESPL